MCFVVVIVAVWVDLHKLILKIIWEDQGPKKVKTTFSKNKMEAIPLSRVKLQ